MKKDQATQLIRLADVFIIAPIIIGASDNENLSPGNRNALAIIGVGTLLYNGFNLLSDSK